MCQSLSDVFIFFKFSENNYLSGRLLNELKLIPDILNNKMFPIALVKKEKNISSKIILHK